MGNRGWIILGSLMLILTACNRVMDRAEYLEYMQENRDKLTVTKNISPYVVTLQYKPVDYVALMELRNREYTGVELAETRERFSGLHHFTLKIRREDGKEVIEKNDERYLKVQEYFSYFMQNDLFLLDGEDSVKCSLFLYERTYGLSTELTFLLGFERKTEEIMNDLTIIFKDRILNTGPLKFKIRKKIRKNIPTLKLEI